ncbi:hypothetical protein N665_0644s0021 [Sinapis alba]|nr:hypothetical protein N665_0644s0021 [Sinapis alba]KAF8085870.1 hypothetical protein N665_0644s0021 [Sinapis alba]
MSCFRFGDLLFARRLFDENQSSLYSSAGPGVRRSISEGKKDDFNGCFKRV